MVPFRTRIAALEAAGYANGPAQAKLAHDVVLAALERSGFGPHAAPRPSRTRRLPSCASAGPHAKKGTHPMDTDNGKPPIDLDKPIENPRLKELRARLESATDEEEQRKLQGELFQEIAENAWFLVIAEWSKPPEANEDGKAFVAAGTTISLHMRGTDDGKRYFEAFTDWEEIGRKHPTDGTTRTLVMGFDDLAGLVLKDGSAAAGFVINPDGDPFLVDRELVGFLRERKRLAAGEIVEEIQKEAERVEVAPLLGMPPPLERALRECVAKDRRIRALWTFLMRRPSQGEESPEELLFVFDAPPDCRREIVESIAAATKPHLDGRMVNLVSSDDGLGKDLSHETPFYRRKFLGLFCRAALAAPCISNKFPIIAHPDLW